MRILFQATKSLNLNDRLIIINYIIVVDTNVNKENLQLARISVTSINKERRRSIKRRRRNNNISPNNNNIYTLNDNGDRYHATLYAVSCGWRRIK